MIRLVCVLAATSSLAGCAVQPPAVSPALPVAPVAIADAVPPVAEEKPEIGTFGFDVAGMNRSVAPGDDWVEFANGTFLRNSQIPADRSSYGMFHRLDDLSRARTREIIEAAARERAAAGTNAQKVGDFYSAFMDETAIEARGAAPLGEDLAPFRDARTKTELATALGGSLDGFAPALFPFQVNQDAKAPDTSIAIFSQAGLGMPDRDYYLSSDAKFADIRAKYLIHAANMLRLTGVPAGEAAAIGHEISHHFDDQGRKYDPTGRLTDWWTPADVTAFEAYATQLADQYSKYEPLPGAFINGRLALGENIADLAGLLVAHDAYRLSLGGGQAPVIDGLTGDQRFFLGHAQIWRNKYREAALRQQLVTGPHSPGHFRPYVVRNLDPWYPAFGAQPGQKLYLAPPERVRIW